MAKYLVVGMDNMYGGEHDMVYWDVMEFDTYEEACEFGRELSNDVIQSYSTIMDEIEADAAEWLIDEGFPEDHDMTESDKYWDLVDEGILNDILYEVYELVPNISIDEIREKYDDWEAIRNEYSVNK